MNAHGLEYRLEGPGDGPVLVLAGSLGSTLAMWDPQVAEFARARRVLRYDHPGHGGSALPPPGAGMADLADQLLALLDTLGLERVDLAGVSLGGMVGMWLAVHRPERIDRLVLCCTSARLGPPSGWDERAAAVRAGGMEAVAGAVIARWFTDGFAAARPQVVATFRANFAAADPEGYARCCEVIRDWDGLADLHRISAPTLVVAGREDRAAPPEHGQAIAAAVPGARLEVLSPAAHLASTEQAAAVNRLMAEHLPVAA